MVSDESCPITHEPKIHTVAPLPPFLFLDFKLQNEMFNFKGVGLADTGSTFGLIEKNQLNKKQLKCLKQLGSKVTGVGGEVKIFGSIVGTVTLGGAKFENVRFDVVDRITDSVQCILGQGIFMHPSVRNFVVDHMNKNITFIQCSKNNGTTVKNKVEYYKPTYKPTIQNVATVNKDVDIKNKTLREKLEYLKREHKIDLYHENREYVEKFVDLLMNNLEIFSDGDLGCFPYEVEIRTQGDPVNVRQHAIAQQYEDSVDEHIKDMLDKGVIEYCSDPKGWNSPIIAVPKKDKSCRICINLKNTVNKRLLQPDPFATQSVDEVFNDFPDGCQFFSSLDFHKGYWQIRLKKNCRHILSFCWKGITYMFVRLPFGFTAAGNIFSRCIQYALNDAKIDSKFTKTYIDDVAVVTVNFEDFLREHEKVFRSVAKFNLRIKAEKCHFLKLEIPFLGRYISSRGMRPIPEFVEGIQAIKPPSNMRELKSLQGRLVWLKSFVGTRLNENVKMSNFSHVMEPIFALSRKTSFEWSSEANVALEKVKKRMTTCPFISYSDPRLPYFLVTDASDVALGGILMQKKGEKYSVIATVSKLFSATERKWSATERECFAVLYCCRKLDYFLSGAQFTVQTDHNSLVYLDRKNFNNAKISRWQSELSWYNFVVEYIEGTTNVWADWLSRPGGIKTEKLKEDFTPAGQYYEVVGTPVRLYLPSWCSSDINQDTLKLRVVQNPKSVAKIVAKGDKREETRIPMSFAAVLSERKTTNEAEISQYVDIADMQREDAFLEKIIHALSKLQPIEKVKIVDILDKNDHRYTGFCKIAEKLYLDPSVGLLMVKNDQNVQVILPDKLRSKYLFAAHDTLSHCGTTRVREHLRSFYWVGKNKDVDEYVATCSLCSKRKGNYGKNVPQFGHNLRGEGPLDVIYLDYVVMPPSNGYRYCLTVVDSFTRYLKVYPLRKNRACDTARELVNFITDFGKIPKVISSDRGTHFVGEVFKNLLQFLNIKQNLHCAWRPESSGLLERQHRTLKNALFVVSKDLSQPWPFVLKQVVQAMNAAENRSTRCSPFYAMFGRHYTLDIPIIEASENVDNAIAHGMFLGSKLQKIHNLVRLSAEDADFKMDSKSKPEKVPEVLQSGDKVLAWRPLSAKAESKFDWIEGFVVISVNNFSAQIKNVATGKIDWYHRRHLRKIRPRPAHLDDDDDEDIVTVSSQNEPIVTPKNVVGKVEPPSTGGGVETKREFDGSSNEMSSGPKVPTSIPKPKKGKKKKSVVNRPVSDRPKRDSRPPDRLNVESTRGKSYT